LKFGLLDNKTNRDYNCTDKPKHALNVDRFLTGSGEERGGIAVRFTNPQSHDITVAYLEMIPWFMRIYLHTMKFKVNTKTVQRE
jgi:hypothetical protein